MTRYSVLGFKINDGLTHSEDITNMRSQKVSVGMAICRAKEVFRSGLYSRVVVIDNKRDKQMYDSDESKII